MRDVAFFGRVPICGDELMKYGVKRALRLLSGYAILQTPHNVEAQPIALGENGIRAAGRLAPRAHIGFVVERNPQIRLGANGDAIEISRRDADDGKWDAIQRDALADDGGIAGKAARPIRIADHHRARRARFFIGIGDTAPQKRSNTKSRKILACDHRAVGQRGLAVDAHGGVLVVKTKWHERENTGHHILLGAEFFELLIRKGKSRLPARHREMRRPFVALPLEKNKVLRIFDGKRSEYDGIDEAEDGGVSADAESESEHGDGGEAGGFAKHPQRVANVLKDTPEKTAAAISQRNGLPIQVSLNRAKIASEEVFSLQFFDGRGESCVFRLASNKEFLVAIFKVLRDLFRNFRFPSWR